MRFPLVTAMAVCVAVASCGTPDTSPLPPNRFVFAENNKVTKDKLVSAFTSVGYQIKKDSDYQLMFDKPATNFGAQLLFGSDFNRTPDARVTLTIIGSRPTTVASSVAIVTNPGSGFEQATSLDSNRDVRQTIATRMESLGGRPVVQH